MRRFTCLLCWGLWLTCTSQLAVAQTVNDAGLWLAAFGQDDIGSKESQWRWWFDGHLRYFDDTDGFAQSIVRPALGRKLTDKLVVWGGYGWIHTSPIVGDDFDEHRIWQQLTWTHTRDEWTIVLRPRLEQRLVETGDDLGWRFRQFVRVQRQLPSHPRLSLIGWNEFFFHLNDTDWGTRTGFDQNRVFAGLGIKRDPRSRVRTEVGYLHQNLDLPTAADRSHHILSINVYY